MAQHLTTGRGRHYTVHVSTEDEDGAPGRQIVDFETTAPTTNKPWA